ncbi:MAG: ATP-binding cassette domain-containing protein [Desulforhopalus sp.]
MLYRLNNLQRCHGIRTVLDIDKLDILANQIYTLIGPNGAGKTSLLKILAFLDKPSGGSLYFLDNLVHHDEKQLSALRRRVVLLDQNPIMFTGSVWKNIEFGLKVRKVAVKARKQRIEEALELVGMENFADYNAKGLSGGETKRVALARALVLQPEVLLCDEPTANVDNENQEIILGIIERINRERKGSIIFSTHYLSQGQRLADHTLLLQNGALSDIASENIYRVTIIESEGEDIVCQLTGQLLLKLPARILPRNVNNAKLHIDPGHIVFNPPAAEARDGNTLSGHVIDLSQHSGQVRVVMDVGIKLALMLSMEQYHREKPGIGDKALVFIPYSGTCCTLINQAM